MLKVLIKQRGTTVDQLKYVSPEYQLQLEELADTLMENRRAKIAEASGQLALFETVEDVRTA